MAGEAEAAPGRIRISAPAAEVRAKIPDRYATVEPDGDRAAVVTTRGEWSRSFLVWMAMLDAPIEVLEPPELVQLARSLAARLGHAA